MVFTLTGKELRLARLSRPADGRFLFVPLDHPVSDGPITNGLGFNRLVRSLVAGGADAVVVHKGRVRLIDPRLLRDCGLIVHLSASTAHAPDPNAKVLVGEVEEAVRLGADGISVHVNVGSPTEAQQLADLGRVAAACAHWGLPLLAMVYPRGPEVADPHQPALLKHVVNIAADLGADLVKTTWAEPMERMAEVVESSPIPVLVAGGAGSDEDVTDFAHAAMSAGCAGLSAGRRVFGHPSPTDVCAALADIVHDRRPEPALTPIISRVVAGTL
ncbi:2-amino-3,7-dideoxy-D-threo-hept-6-ulosonate synthase [Streptomyces gamaensis]|uniref:2-amino-3,7-dideoxy-D-threo-hept-6-ulosonate synthase n=1 Tax=Streptomyces gamaensis TaxID=1763542 RepID=A0ABW0YTY2_9ACTN